MRMQQEEVIRPDQPAGDSAAGALDCQTSERLDHGWQSYAPEILDSLLEADADDLLPLSLTPLV
jgi:hypothetical protein